MKTQRKALVEELLETLAPHLAGVLNADGHPGKALAKSIQQLAEQLLRARAKQQKRARHPAGPAPQVTEQLTATLRTALEADVAGGTYLGKKATKVIEASAEQLAGKLVKLQHKRQSKVSHATPPTAADDSVAPVAPASAPRRAGTRRPSRPEPPTPADTE